MRKNEPAGDVQQQVDEETEKGFRGVKVDPVPDEEYTLATGPSSPPYLPDDKTRVGQHSPTTKDKD